MIAIMKPTKIETAIIREISKAHGIKGCRMSLRTVLAGRQSVVNSPEKGKAFTAALEKAGFFVETCILFDVFMVSKIA